MTVIAAMGVTLINVQTSIARRHEMSVDTKRALYIAEAGIAEAAFAVAQGRSGNVASAESPAKYGHGVYWVEAEDVGDDVFLRSTGLAGRGRFSISAVLRREVNPVGSLGVFGAERILVRSGATLDGVHSMNGEDQGKFGGPMGPQALVASNGDILIEGVGQDLEGEQGSVTYISGDVHPGPGGVLVIEPGADVTGSTAPTTQFAELPAIAVPEVKSEGTCSIPTGTTKLLEKRQIHFDAVEVAGRLTLAGPVALVVDEFHVAKGGTIEIDATNGPVALLCTKSLHWAKGSIVEDSCADATKVALMLTGQKAEIESAGELFATVYAPLADLEWPASLRLTGSLSARTLTIGEDAHVTFDHALRGNGVGVDLLPQLVSWQVVELPNVSLVKRRVDPNLTLKLDGVTPLDTNAAARERKVVLEYLDQDGVKQTFQGAPSAMNWKDLATVISAQWIDPATGNALPIKKNALPSRPSMFAVKEAKTVVTEGGSTIVLHADQGYIRGPGDLVHGKAFDATYEDAAGSIQAGDVTCVLNWVNPSDTIEWTGAEIPAGTYDIFLSMAVDPTWLGSTFVIEIGDEEYARTVTAITGSSQDFRRVPFATLIIGDVTEVDMRPTSFVGGGLMNLEALYFVPK